ncbi:Cas1 appressorium specific protein [Pleurostoma richardsiae]|uniref:Cas1 appressorium specific protein n=1 Tax=Pleurostoma richardsiae TaxID=41990 RepID=A0AA38VPN1_9PEZI|nr:Cas1 appressorium specific protein [Pleurostoma richardsiae]
MSSTRALATLLLLAAAELVSGHGAIIKAAGDAGGTGMALGIDTSTPRDGTRRNPFQQDSTRFRGDAADTVGETLGGGTNDVEAGTQAILAETGDQLPQVTPGGEVSMTLHQVNADGGGPYTCMINDDGTAETWEDIAVTTTPPGENSRNRDGAATDFPLVAAVPADQTCTGSVAGQDNVCLVRCQNDANAGPFGGIVPVQIAGASNATAAAKRGLTGTKLRWGRRI